MYTATLLNISRNQTNMDKSFFVINLATFLKKILLPEIITLVVISVFTILGNTLVLVTTWTEKSLHQPNKYIITCLAFANLLVGLFIAPLGLHINNLFLKSHTIATNSILLCRFTKWIDTFALTASIISLVFISFDRYLKLSRPLRYKLRMTTSACLKLIFIIWLISAAFACFSLTPHSGGRGFQYFIIAITYRKRL